MAKFINFRNTHTKQEMTRNELEREFVRPKRFNIPNSWSDLVRRVQRSWKNQSKYRKQWMAGSKIHGGWYV